MDPSVVAAIVQAAREQGVDPVLALATAFQESGLNPNAVGDQGCSIGLFQLNTCGGEGVGLSSAQLHDPLTNARRALSEFAAVQRSNPGLSGGALAAAAQRPANPSAYAAAVNSIYHQLLTAPNGILHGLESLVPFSPAAAVAGAGFSQGKQAAGAGAPSSGGCTSLLDVSCWLNQVLGLLQRAFWVWVALALVALGILLLVVEDFREAAEKVAPAAAAASGPEVLAA